MQHGKTLCVDGQPVVLWSFMAAKAKPACFSVAVLLLLLLSKVCSDKRTREFILYNLFWDQVMGYLTDHSNRARTVARLFFAIPCVRCGSRERVVCRTYRCLGAEREVVVKMQDIRC